MNNWSNYNVCERNMPLPTTLHHIPRRLIEKGRWWTFSSAPLSYPIRRLWPPASSTPVVSVNIATRHSSVRSQKKGVGLRPTPGYVLPAVLGDAYVITFPLRRLARRPNAQPSRITMPKATTRG